MAFEMIRFMDNSGKLFFLQLLLLQKKNHRLAAKSSATDVT